MGPNDEEEEEGMANETHKPLVTLTMLFKTLSLSALQYDGHILHTNNVLPPSCVGQLSSTRLCYHSMWPGQPTTKNMRADQNQPK